jgi:hypothetical protein
MCREADWELRGVVHTLEKKLNISSGTESWRVVSPRGGRALGILGELGEMRELSLFSLELSLLFR